MSKYDTSLEMLFVSKVRIKSLKYFLLNPGSKIHLRGAVREFKEEINAVRRELLRLEEMALLKTETGGNRKYFFLNIEHPFIDELISMFHKSYGIGSEIINNSRKLGTIDYAILTPSYTKMAYYGSQVIDMAIIGVVDMHLLSSIVKEFESDFGREIHYTVLKPSEFQIRKRRKDDFIMNLMIQDVVMLLGNHEDFIKEK
ncbi:hypothetical protein KC669_02985 [Candidatus Dojkabacteria bacterium]|uniref:Transcriptional regulator n=1 Tax=Candidatus Dojkabacteria bacterium TaxID=2099670 RepID=A0A955LA56_9BACT|nr:hypothetical protein [Candidatus Dojkabacteria bacterium]